MYSDVSAQGTLGLHYLRGWQVTNASGMVAFSTIIPGRYTGRTNHVHMRVAYNNLTQGFFNATTQARAEIARTVQSAPSIPLRQCNHCYSPNYDSSTHPHAALLPGQPDCPADHREPLFAGVRSLLEHYQRE